MRLISFALRAESWLSSLLLCLFLSGTTYAERVNLAKLQAASASTADGADPALFATDGVVGNGQRWKSDGAAPHWLRVNLPLPMQLGSAHLYLGRDDLETVASFSLQYWTGSTWATIPGTAITGNTATVRNLVFTTPVTTAQVRFYTTDATARLREIALFAPNGPSGYPLGTDVTLSLAKKRPTTASSVDGANFSKGGVDGYAEDTAGRWKSDAVNGPHTWEVDLQVSSRVGSAHVYSGGSTTAAVADFTVQYWTGSAWSAFPGGAMVGNTQKELRINFTTPVATSRVRLLIPGNGTQRIRELAVFAAAAGVAEYPLWTDVFAAAPPGTQFDTYGDGFWKIVNRSSGRSLIATDSGAGHSLPTTSEDEKQFELLYNLDSDTFRLRNRDTWNCIAAKNAGKTPGTAVVELPDYQAMPHEVWRFQDVGGGDFRVLNVWNGLALESDGATPGTVSLATPSTSTRQFWRFEYQTHFPKKGFAGHDGDWQRVGANWSYNWGRETGVGQPAHFVFTPMQYGRWWPDFNTLPHSYPAWHTTGRPLAILGYNEPEESSQGNTPVGEGIALWAKLQQTDMPLVSPAPVNPFTPWINEFFTQINAQGLRVDYTAIHWYSPPNVDGLISHLQNVFNTYGRPVWLTEFSNIDWGGGATWTDEDCYRFIAEFTWRAEDLLWLKRYSIFPVHGDLSPNPWDRHGDSSSFFLNDGTTLTPFGEFYAAWDADRSLRDRTPYYLQGLGSMHRLRASSISNALSTGNIRRSDVSAQFARVPNAAGTRHYIVSLRDGRRLRFDGSMLELAPPGTTGATVEWTFNGPDGSGYTYIDHPSTSKSLRLSRTNDGNGAPTALTYSMPNFGTAADTTRWRFIKPFQPAEVLAPEPIPSLQATPGDGQVTLTWGASPAPDLLGYSIYRRPTATGTYTRLASGLTSLTYTDLTAQNRTTYRYVVSAVDWLDSESVYSPEASTTPVVSGSTYASWVSTALAGMPAAETTMEADPDRDGLVNGIEYATLTDPRQPSPSLLKVSQDAAGRLLLTYQRNRGATDVQFAILAANDLRNASNWPVAPVELVSQVAAGPVDRVTVRPVESGDRRMFYKLRVQIGP